MSWGEGCKGARELALGVGLPEVRGGVGLRFAPDARATSCWGDACDVPHARGPSGIRSPQVSCVLLAGRAKHDKRRGLGRFGHQRECIGERMEDCRLDMYDLLVPNAHRIPKGEPDVRMCKANDQLLKPTRGHTGQVRKHNEWLDAGEAAQQRI